MSEKLLLVNWGTKDKQYTLQALDQKNVEVYLATSKSYPEWVLDYVSRDKLIFTNTYKVKNLISDVIDFMSKQKVSFDYITTFFEMNMLQTARLARYLGLDFLDPKIVMRTSANKLLMRHFFDQASVNQPRFALFKGEASGLNLTKKLSGDYTQPLVIKPVVSGHSYGVLKISGSNQHEYRADFKEKYKFAQDQLNSNFDEWMKHSQFKQYFLLEEYIPGKMVSVDGLVAESEIYFSSVTDFKISQPPLFLQYETYVPSHLGQPQKQIAVQTARQLIEHLGIKKGGFHCELKLHQGEAYVIEFAARLPGGQMLEAYKTAYGIDLADLYLDLTLGKTMPPLKQELKKYVLQESIPLDQEGRLVSIKGLNQFVQNDNFDFFSIAPEGKIIQKQGEIFEPLVYYQARSATKTGLKQLQEKFKKNISAEISFNPAYKLYELRDKLYRLTPKFLKKVLFNNGCLDKLIRLFE